ncbi:hypothetical protein AHF37_06918 [Paragonimus kellicotti]|nr:hypothetical protein AHF37_06918 [Paragonimus kellicotti]
MVRRYSYLYNVVNRNQPHFFHFIFLTFQPLPGKMLTTALDRFSDEFLAARSSGLNTFLRRLSRHPLLSADPDVIAFLTLLNDDFHKHQAAHPATGVLSTLLSDTRLGPLSTHMNSTVSPISSSSADPDSPSSSRSCSTVGLADVAMSLIGSSSMHRYESEFRTMSDEATKLVAKATADLVAQLRTVTLPKWRDAASYAQSIQNVLDSRNNLEKRYFAKVEELKHETAAMSDTTMTGRLSSISRNYFHWRPRSLPVLVSDTDKLQDQVSYCNGHIRAEYSRWRAERSEETIQNLLQMSQIYMNYWACVASGWRGTVTELEPCCVNYPTQMDILEPISESTETQKNAESPSSPSSDKPTHEDERRLTSDPGSSSQTKSSA